MIEKFLHDWLGAWPPTSPCQVVGSARRAEPGWNGQLRVVQGVSDGHGNWVVSVDPTQVDRFQSIDPEADPVVALAEVAGMALFMGTFRYSEAPADLEPAGRWTPATASVVPEWLRPFGGEVLVELDSNGDYLAGVGLKRHLPNGWEISVGTEPAARGQGLARRLVATAASTLLARGIVPIYLHANDNIASARAADGAGFPDRGWQVLGADD